MGQTLCLQGVIGCGCVTYWELPGEPLRLSMGGEALGIDWFTPTLFIDLGQVIYR